MALAHTISNKVEAAYRRGDLFEKRRQLMENWARQWAKSPSGEVVRSLSRGFRYLNRAGECTNPDLVLTQFPLLMIADIGQIGGE